MKTVVVFCEGKHDVFFLYRLFKTIHFKNDSRKISEITEPLNRYLAKIMNEYKYENLTLDNIRPPLPSLIMKRTANDHTDQEEILLLLYALGGDGQEKKAKKIIHDFSDWFQEPKNSERVGDINVEDYIGDNTYSFAYILDADLKGIPERVKTINEIFKNELGESGASKIDHNRVIQWGAAAVGCFIFSGDNLCGRLEDIIYPLMEMGNEEIFSDARRYFEKHYKDETKKKDESCDKQKSSIGIAGQLFRSGVSNAVIIQHSDYLSPQKIKDHPKCQEIIEFFNKLISFQFQLH